MVIIRVLKLLQTSLGYFWKNVFFCYFEVHVHFTGDIYGLELAMSNFIRMTHTQKCIKIN